MDSQDGFRRALEQAKRGSASHGLIKAGRLVDTLCLGRARERFGADLRPAHLRLFPHIDLEGTRVTVIAERLGSTKQAVAVLVDELETMGVLRRVPDPHDARARLVQFANRPGRSLLDGMGVLAEFDEELERCLGAPRLRRLRRDLNALVEHLEALTGK